jgi:hypothetical protein
MRCASGIALFNSLGLVSGGLRKQAATFFSIGVVEQWSDGVLEGCAVFPALQHSIVFRILEVIL